MSASAGAVKPMTSRQRVTEAINHREPDRMPMDLGMHTSTGISAFAYSDLRAYLGLPAARIEIIDGVQMLARVDEDILRLFGCDCVCLKPPVKEGYVWSPRDDYAFFVPEYYRPEASPNGEWTVRRNGQSMRMPTGGLFFDGDWLAMEDAWEPSFFRETALEAERLFKETDYFTAFRGFYPFFNSDMDYFCDMMTDPVTLIRQNEVSLQTQLRNAALLIDRMKGYIGAVCLSGDLGDQRAPMVRSDVFEAVSAPFLRVFCSFIHRHSDYKVFLHSCGAIEPLLPVLIDCGIDIINPVQITAGGMDPETLKKKYGGDLVFWGGGVDTQRLLPFGSPEQVAENARYLTGVFKPGGGYVFCPVHNIMGGTRPENIAAAYEAARENGMYR